MGAAPVMDAYRREVLLTWLGHALERDWLVKWVDEVVLASFTVRPDLLHYVAFRQGAEPGEPTERDGARRRRLDANADHRNADHCGSVTKAKRRSAAKRARRELKARSR